MKNHLLAVLILLVAFPAKAEGLKGVWRITHGVSAPWAEDAPVAAPFVGKRATFADDVVTAPAPLGCANAVHKETTTPPEGLFQGGLPAPAAEKARSLGFAPGPAAGVSLSCSSGVFEFHFADADAALFALDNVVWTMSRAYGATAPAQSPEGVVEAFLEFHFNNDYGFLEPNEEARRRWLSKGLMTAIGVYFDRPFPKDEAPPINGDPFTDTQEFPTRFAVRQGDRTSKTARVPVDFADGYTERRQIYLLVRQGGAWRIDDIDYDHDGTFREAMKAPF